MCHEIERTIDTLTAYTHTSCSPSKGRLPGTYSLIIISSGPVFSGQSSEKGWLLVAVAAAGYALNKNGAVKGGELWFSDPDNMKSHIAYEMSLKAAKSLQRRVKSHRITPEVMYSEIKKDLTRKQIPKR